MKPAAPPICDCHADCRASHPGTFGHGHEDGPKDEGARGGHAAAGEAEEVLMGPEAERLPAHENAFLRIVRAHEGRTEYGASQTTAARSHQQQAAASSSSQAALSSSKQL